MSEVWTEITDSVLSLPPQDCWILLALPREGGVVVEACYDGFRHVSHLFHLRNGMTIYGEDVLAWRHMPDYPRELEG